MDSTIRTAGAGIASALSALAGLLAGCDPDPPGALRFVERTAGSGVEFVSISGGAEKDYILEVNGGGCALFDYDGDGDLDIFFVNGARFEDDPRAASAPPPSDVLYRNDGDWRFTDVTREAGLEESAWGCGCAVADVDNDGDLDLFVTNYGPDELWLNDGDGTFTRAGEKGGLADEAWGASAAFLDYDRDGLVDLFVVNYLVFDRDRVKPRGPESCRYKGQPILCGPVGLPQGHCVLYRNLGDGRFADVSDAAGITARSGYGLGVAVGDYDRDGWPDVYVAADTSENLLYRNLGDGRFEELGLAAGVARNDVAIAQAGMGVEFAFVRNPDLEDLFVVNYEDDTNTYYANDGDGYFTEVTSAVGLASPCFQYLGWSCFFVDFDFDADLDLFIAQGHVVPQVDAVETSPGYRQKNKLFLNDGGGKFRDGSEAAGPGLQVEKSSRGAAYGDLDGDGDVDLVVNEIDERATLIECRGKPLGHWLGLRLEGSTSNRAAIGAVARVHSGGRIQARRVKSGTGYASHSELTLRFGLGTATRVEEVRVLWPAGGVESFRVDGVDRVVTLREGTGEAAAARGDG
ncbi:MAG: CRTAC1 family protein [Planctomycetota bacterium]|nr:CRTAC1 family protein [Planctomycetota bacterium]